MRFIHTADWHLGRQFHGRSLVEDQSFVLNQLIECAKDQKPDVIVVAGDIYDRAIPPPDAVELLDEVLSKLAIDLGIPTVLIAGNHDSPKRLQFASRLLAKSKLFVAGNVKSPCLPIEIADAYGKVSIYPVPFSEPAFVRLVFPEIVLDHDSAMKRILADIRQAHPHGLRSIVMAHAFVAGGTTSESERPLSVGGTGMVDASHFSGFDYVALGHLHRPQSLFAAPEKETLFYSGSILKYSFDEVGQEKSVRVVDMDATGQFTSQIFPLKPKHEVHRITGSFANLTAAVQIDVAKDDYVEITLEDDRPILNSRNRLSEIYPNLMCMKRTESSATVPSHNRPDVRKTTDLELFRSFYKSVTDTDIDVQQEAFLIQVLEQMDQQQRETGNSESTAP